VKSSLQKNLNERAHIEREKLDFEIKRQAEEKTVKSVLPEGALSHLLRYEATLERKWANKNDLADVLDTYSASYDRFDMPKVSAIGANINQRASQCSQGQGHGQNYRSNNVMSENKSFNSSETSHVEYDHTAK